MMVFNQLDETVREFLPPLQKRGGRQRRGLGFLAVLSLGDLVDQRRNLQFVLIRFGRHAETVQLGLLEEKRRRQDSLDLAEVTFVEVPGKIV